MCHQYTPDVTHVACDHDVAEATLCHHLGLERLSDLPSEVPVVFWEWFHKSSTVSGSLYFALRV